MRLIADAHSGISRRTPNIMTTTTIEMEIAILVTVNNEHILVVPDDDIISISSISSEDTISNPEDDIISISSTDDVEIVTPSISDLTDVDTTVRDLIEELCGMILVKQIIYSLLKIITVLYTFHFTHSYIFFFHCLIFRCRQLGAHCLLLRCTCFL